MQIYIKAVHKSTRLKMLQLKQTDKFISLDIIVETVLNVITKNN